VVVPSDASTELLGGLDVLAYYPAEAGSAGFPYTALKAMALNIPFIAPPRFASCFPQAMVSAESAAILSTVRTLWSDEPDCQAQARAGHDCVDKTCGPKAFKRHLSAYLDQARKPSRSSKGRRSEGQGKKQTSLVSEANITFVEPD
jgi:hypothetical protein